MLAFDRKTIDQDGRLHCTAPISKAAVNPYLGSEINAVMDGTRGWRRLAADKTYQLLRPAEELRKAASTFRNLPVLSQHVPVNAVDYQPSLVIGSIGSDVAFADPYLQSSLVIWAKPSIDRVNGGQQRELSSAYRYRADMRPGTTSDGVRYDGVMRDLVGNHVALVSEGRAGSDVALDEKPRDGRRTFYKMFPDAERIGHV